MNNRFDRQIALSDFGKQGQQALFKAKVFIVGAGGLGCPVVQYLSAMGVGTIGMADFDTVNLSNLHRQVLYDTHDIGELKVDVVKRKITAVYPEITLNTFPIAIEPKTCINLFKDYDVVVDCSDNFPTRYMVNDACVVLQKPLVFAAVSRYEGQVGVLNLKMPQGFFSCHYRDFYPTMPPEGEILNCAEAGILGVLAGIIGTLQASEVVKVIIGKGELLANQILCYNMLNNQFHAFKLNKKQSTLAPLTEQAFLQREYHQTCLTQEDELSIDNQYFDTMLKQQSYHIVDVREKDEQPTITQFQHEKISLDELQNHLPNMSKDNYIFLCQSGMRSLKAAKMASEYFSDKKRFFSLKGGIANWMNKH